MSVNERTKEIMNKRVFETGGKDDFNFIRVNDIEFLIHTLMNYKDALEEISRLDIDDEGSLEIALQIANDILED